MNILLMTVGLPRSGKSTWAKKQGHPIVNPDSIRLSLHGQAYVSLAEPYVWAIAKTMVQALFLAGHETVILDATNTTAKRRDDWLGDNWRCIFKEFDVGRDECIHRAKVSGRQDLIPVIERMDDSIEWPSRESD